ncbi:ABC transporter permease [Pseudomonas sp. CFBP 8770]|uniref:ABC transporter permease n=1 Tax=unclassified Pseudomonas TaxID=196821 RepID=UPI00177C9F9F|nr:MULTISPECIES: ABC transporter permease [unclassified Pseudomonas]MBD8472996.1 ABC transporter permease [Pseudomonas sp. CFBP 8773]MBD8645901.1 ABC transporter permease [Pseudomonas sp. CFBP 8770]MBD8680267.1 ABC transporter permease [Pseudomonas sp. CFBP 13719]
MNLWIDRLRLLCKLAVEDLWHDRKVSLCIAASLVAVIAPLLLLFGLKHGVVSQLQNELMRDPRNLEVKMLSSGSFDEPWVIRLQQMPETGFAIGQTRSLNAQADLQIGLQRFVENAEIIPTQAGDPLLNTPASSLQGNDLILSASAAQRLQAEIGSSVRLRAARRLDGVSELGEINLNVVAILDASRFGRAAAFIAPTLLLSLEHFRDGYQVPAFGLNSGRPLGALQPLYARARVYARNIDSVAALEQWLTGQNIQTSSRLADIENVKAINRVLGLIFGVIAAAALTGCIASLVGAFLANIDRKRKSLAVLRLLGFSSPAVAGFVILQAVMLSLVGYAGGLAFYLAGSRLFDQLLGITQSTGAFVCHITPWHALTALVLSLLVAVLVALIGAVRAIGIQPAESLREL